MREKTGEISMKVDVDDEESTHGPTFAESEDNLLLNAAATYVMFGEDAESAVIDELLKDGVMQQKGRSKPKPPSVCSPTRHRYHFMARTE